MKINVMTDKPQVLINAIEKAIKDGNLKTWDKVVNAKGQTLYTHTPEQWNGKAMPKPYFYDDKIRFEMEWWSKNEEPSEEVKGYILGRFTEVLMVHFSNYFSNLEIYP